MLTKELDYHLPPELIAQRPVVPRDRSRLLVYNRVSQEIQHRRLRDITAFLSPGDVLVYNNSRVLRARVFAVKPTGGRVELLFLRRRREETWEAMVKPSARLKMGTSLKVMLPPEALTSQEVLPDYPLVLKENLGAGLWLVENLSGVKTEELLEQVGEMPLPPYIKEPLKEPERYQTVYATEPGSAAAPTAGLHFTPELIESIQAAGVRLLPVTLHIGLDTFRPICEDDLSHHQIHTEHYCLPVETFEAVREAKKHSGKVVAVGTSSVRVLETVFRTPHGPLEGDTQLFITPGFEFRVVDALLTNFHLPKSTLLALVMAFAGVSETRRLYREAVRQKYRFYSFGDAMLVR